MISLPHSKKEVCSGQVRKAWSTCVQAYGIPTQPGRQKRHNVAKSFEESAGFDMCITALSQLFPKLEKLAMLHQIPLDFRFKRRQVNVLSFLFCKSASHSD